MTICGLVGECCRHGDLSAVGALDLVTPVLQVGIVLSFQTIKIGTLFVPDAQVFLIRCAYRQQRNTKRETKGTQAFMPSSMRFSKEMFGDQLNGRSRSTGW